MVKDSPVARIAAGSIQPGKYVVVVTGDTASVEVALQRGHEVGAGSITDAVFLPDVHDSVTARLAEPAALAETAGQALGIVETVTIPAALNGADAAVKAADVDLAALVLGDGLGGRAYFLLVGDVADVEAAFEAGLDRGGEQVYRSELISQLHADMAANIEAALGLNVRLTTREDA